MRLTTVSINRAFRRLRLTAVLVKDGALLWHLKVAAQEGGELHFWTTVRRVNRYDLAGWLETAERGIDWARSREARIREREGNGKDLVKEMLRIADHEKAPEAKPFANDGPVLLDGVEVRWVKTQVVNMHTAERADILILNGRDLAQRFTTQMQRDYGNKWRLSRSQPVGIPDIAGYVAPKPVEQEANLSLEDAVALAHLVAEDLATGYLKGEKLQAVREIVNGRIEQANGAYKYVLLVGRWAIKVDKGRKPGDYHYVGSAGEATLIEHLKQQHAHLAKHFPITAVVNYFTAVQERADIDGNRYDRQSKLINTIAKEMNIGDFHAGNVGYRPNDDTPVFIDVARSGHDYGARPYHHFNKLFVAEYEHDEARRSLKEAEKSLTTHRQAVAEKAAAVATLKQGA